MKRLCFGGSFNPIHAGHLVCARHAAERLGFDSVVLIPTGQPPHKPDASDFASSPHRLRMCELAAGACQDFEVNDIETRRSGPSFTIETARALVSQGWGRISWLIGADMLLTLPKWHEPEALLNEVDFVILARPGWEFDWNSMPPTYRRLRDQVVEAPLIEISATEIRKRVREGLPIDCLTPEPVVRYIHETGLYRRPQG